VKYIAKRAAKNMSSEDSQTMVPTDVVSGRLAGTWVRAVGVAVATSRIIAVPSRSSTPDPPTAPGRIPWPIASRP
jgi:hypothetical protein